MNQNLDEIENSQEFVKERRKLYLSNWFPPIPPTPEFASIPPETYITKKIFVPQRQICSEETDFISKAEEQNEELLKLQKEKELGKEVQDFYENLVMIKNQKEEIPIEKKHIFHCEICALDLTFETVEEHLNSVVHLFALSKVEGKPSKKYFIPESNIGYQLLKKLNWNENQGLGKDGGGVLDPVKTTLKFDKKGVGSASNLQPRITHFKPNQIPNYSSFKKNASVIKKRKLTKSQKRNLQKLEKEKEQQLRYEIYS